MGGEGKAHIFIGTPAYSGWVNYRYMFTVLGLVTSGVQCTVQVDPWAALLTTARNDVEGAKAEGRVYRWPSMKNPGTSRDVYDVFTVGTADGLYDTEDWSMCRQLRGLGFTVYVDPTVRVSHYGMHEFVPEEVKRS